MNLPTLPAPVAAAWASVKTEAAHFWDKAKAHPVIAAGVGAGGLVVGKLVSDAHKKRFR